MNSETLRTPTGMYRSSFEHDACGIGALANLKGVRSHQMVDDALSVLVNLEHRGGVGLEPNTGDGAGILLQIPHHFFRKEAQKYASLLPDEGNYGVAMLFLPTDEHGLTEAMRVFEDGCIAEGIPLLFWRDVPTDAHDLGSAALECMPIIKQAFLGRPDDCETTDDFERRLYMCRRVIEKRAKQTASLENKTFYIKVCSYQHKCVGSLKILMMRLAKPLSRLFIRATQPIRLLHGNALIQIATSFTTEKSIRFIAISIGREHENLICILRSWETTLKRCSLCLTVRVLTQQCLITCWNSLL